MTRCLRSKIFTTYLFGQNYLGKMMSNILPTIKLALKLELYIMYSEVYFLIIYKNVISSNLRYYSFHMFLVLGNKNFMKNANKEMIELAFASHIR